MALSPQAALACGAMVSESGQAELLGFEALLRWDGNREDLTVTVAYRSGDPKFAWLMPLPSPPTVSPVRDNLVAKAFQITEPPQLDEPESKDEGATAPPAVGGASGVNVIGRESAVGFRFVTLGGKEAPEVGRWMRVHGYAFHDRQEPVLQGYLDRGWVVVAAKVTPGHGVSTDNLHPVRFEFRSTEPIYPMAMAGTGHAEQDLGVRLFVLSPYRPTSTTYEERLVRPNANGLFSSPGRSLEMRYSAPLGDLAARMKATPETWLTRYEANLSTTDLVTDLVFARSADQTPIDYSDLENGDRVLLWVARIGVLLVAAVLAIWISLGMARRRRASEAPRMPGSGPSA